ncbi:MAG: hypothetical protein CL537_15055 [Alcanivoracaceae bacterium]|nr:hypothetical protein [Alcanivoracaceae bacterium]|tara:strand:+ start:1771 stop:2019 length:249 start_codon:yes stop_codon:yes gene_type:complete
MFLILVWNRAASDAPTDRGEDQIGLLQIRDADEVSAHYRDHDLEIRCLSSKNILEHEPGFRERGLTALEESCWQLMPAGSLR